MEQNDFDIQYHLKSIENINQLHTNINQNENPNLNNTLNQMLKFHPLISARAPVSCMELFPELELSTSEFNKFSRISTEKVAEFLDYQFSQKDSVKTIEDMLKQVDISYLKLKSPSTLPTIKDCSPPPQTYPQFVNKTIEVTENLCPKVYNQVWVPEYQVPDPMDLVEGVKSRYSSLDQVTAANHKQHQYNPKYLNGKHPSKRTFSDSQSSYQDSLQDLTPNNELSPVQGNDQTSNQPEDQEELHDSFQELSLSNIITNDQHTLENGVTQSDVHEDIANNFYSFCQSILKDQESIKSQELKSNSLVIEMDGHLILSTSSIKKLDTLFTKIVSYQIFDKIDLDILIQLSELLKSTIDACSNKFIDFAAKKDAKEAPDLTGDQLPENETLASIVNAMIAANLALQVSLHHQTNTRIYNEDMILGSILLMKNQLSKTVRTCIDTIDSNTNTFVTTLKRQKLGEYKKLVRHMNELISQLITFLTYFIHLMKSNEFSNVILVGIGFSSIATLFIDSSVSTSIFTQVTLESLKLKCATIVQLIFVKYADQRMWILDEVLGSVIKLPTDKRCRKDYKLSNSESIQMVSALMLQFVQGCFDVVTNSDTLEIPQFHEFLRQSNLQNDQLIPILKNMFEKIKNSTENSLEVSRSILNFFLSRLTGKQGNESDYKAIFNGFLEDLATSLHLPEWPAAELILRLFVKVMIGYLDDTKSDNALKTLAIETLGQIALKIKQLDVSQLDKELSHHFNLLQQQNSKNFKIKFDHIPSQLGVTTTCSEIESVWVCVTKVFEYLQYSSWHNSPADISANYFFCSWILTLCSHFPQIFSDKSSDMGEFDPKVIQLLQRKIGQGIQSLFNTDELTRSLNASFQLKKSNRQFIYLIYSRIIQYLPLYKSFHQICITLIQSIETSSSPLRIKALRSIALLAQSYPEILSEEVVRDIIGLRLNDNSPTVRDAAVDIFGKYITTHPESAKDYLPLISKRVQDTSIMVRKRVIRLLKIIYFKETQTDQLIEISLKIFNCLYDTESTIKSLAVKTLQEFWFAPLATYPKDELNDEEGTFYIEYKFLPLATKQEISHRIAVVVGLVKHFSLADSRTIGEFIHKTLKRPESERKELYNEWTFNVALSQYFIEGLLSHMLYLEESNQKGPIASAICALHIFGIAAPNLFRFEHLSLLQNYLQIGPNSDDIKKLYFTLTIFKNIIPNLRFPKFSFLKSVENQILTIVNQFSESILEVAIPCLCSIIAEVTQHYKIVIALYKACFQKLERAKSMLTEGKAPQLVKSVVRLILIVGLLAKHIDIDSKKSHLMEDGVDFNFLGDSTFVDMTFEFIMYYMDESNHATIRSFAVKSLGLLFLSHPHLTLNTRVTSAISKIFASDDHTVTTSLMLAFHDFVSEDSGKQRDQLKTLEDADENKGPQIVNVDDLIGQTNIPLDTGICANLMQAHLDDILRCMLHDHLPLVNASLNVIGILLTSGYVHPLKIIPSLVAVQTHSDDGVSRKAVQLHITMVSKYPSFIHSVNHESVKALYGYQRRQSATLAFTGFRFSDTHGVYQSQLHHLFAAMGETKPAKKEFLNLMLKNFDIHSVSVSIDEIDLDYLKFVAEAISTLEFKSYEDVIYLIFAINQILSVAGASVLDTVTGEPPSPEMPNFRLYGKLSIAFSYLLGLKFYVRDQYELNDSKHLNLVSFDNTKFKDRPLNRLPDLDPSAFWTKYTRPDVMLNRDTVLRSFEHIRQLFAKDAETSELLYAEMGGFGEENLLNSKAGKKVAKMTTKKRNAKYDEDDDEEFMP